MRLVTRAPYPETQKARSDLPPFMLHQQTASRQFVVHNKKKKKKKKQEAWGWAPNYRSSIVVTDEIHHTHVVAFVVFAVCFLTNHLI